VGGDGGDVDGGRQDVPTYFCWSYRRKESEQSRQGNRPLTCPPHSDKSTIAFPSVFAQSGMASSCVELLLVVRMGIRGGRGSRSGERRRGGERKLKRRV